MKQRVKTDHKKRGGQNVTVVACPVCANQVKWLRRPPKACPECKSALSFRAGLLLAQPKLL